MILPIRLIVPRLSKMHFGKNYISIRYETLFNAKPSIKKFPLNFTLEVET